jgi:hypothetical protein
MSEGKLLKDGKEYTSAAATNVMATFERQLVNGKFWVRPSRDPETIAKWKRFQEMHLKGNTTQPN